MSAVDTSSFQTAISQMQKTNQEMLQYQQGAVNENRKFGIETATLENEASVTEKMQSVLQTLARNSAS